MSWSLQRNKRRLYDFVRQRRWARRAVVVVLGPAQLAIGATLAAGDEIAEQWRALRAAWNDPWPE